jgi:hypothetical protein
MLMCDGAVRFVSENINTNPALQTTAACTDMLPAASPPQAPAGATWQILYFPNDGQTVGEF